MYPGMQAKPQLGYKSEAKSTNVATIIDNLLIYPVKNRLSIADQIKVFLHRYPDFELTGENFVMNNGERLKLIRIYGKMRISTNHKGMTIPLSFWLPPQFPNVPPNIFIEPRAGTRIVKNNLNVDLAGQISHEYLENWKLSSSLLHMGNLLITLFTSVPPLEEIEKNPIPYPVSASFMPKNTISLTSSTSQKPSFSSSTIQKTSFQQTKSVPYPETGFEQTPYQSSIVDINGLRQKLKYKAFEKIEAMERHSNQFISNHRSIQTNLKSLEAQLTSCSSSISQHLSELESIGKQLKEENNLLGEKLRQFCENDEFNSDVLKLVVPKNALSEEMIEVYSGIKSLEDMLFCLDKLLQEEKVSLHKFLRLIRKYSKQEFLLKIRAREILRKQEGT